MKKTQNIDLRSFHGDLRKYLQISFCPVSMFFGLQNYFLALKIVVSSLFKPSSWRKPKILIYDWFRVICVNICKSLFVQFQWFLGSKITSWHWKWWFWTFSNLTIEKQNKTFIYDHLRVICVSISKSLFVSFWWFLGFKITSWH